MAEIGLGDELMVSGLCRVAQQTDPRKVRVQYEKGKRRWCELWDGNPRIATWKEEGDFQILEPRQNYLRPYCEAKTERQWTWKEYHPPHGEIYFYPWEKAFGDVNRGHVVLAPWLKAGASPNKQWGERRWQELARLLGENGLKLLTMGPGQPRITSKHINCSIRQAAAVIETARAVVTHEGAIHHIAAALGTPAVVIRGGYIGPRVTGYDGQVDFFGDDGLGCGMRVPCAHCAAAMAAITPEAVAEKTLKVTRD